MRVAPLYPSRRLSSVRDTVKKALWSAFLRFVVVPLLYWLAVTFALLGLSHSLAALAAEPLHFGETITARKVSMQLPIDFQKIRLSDTQLRDVLTQAGFPKSQHTKIIAIVRAESGGRPFAFNGNAKTNDKSYGIFQINMRGALSKSRLASLGLNSEKDLYDPLTNAKAAFAISSGGTRWRPWGAFTSGAYLKYL